MKSSSPTSLHELEIIFRTFSSNRSDTQIQKIYEFLITHSDIQKEPFWYILTKKEQCQLCRYIQIHYIYEDDGLDLLLPCSCHPSNNFSRHKSLPNHSQSSIMNNNASKLYFILRGEVTLLSTCPICCQKNPNNMDRFVCKSGALFGQMSLPGNLISLTKGNGSKGLKGGELIRPFHIFSDPFTNAEILSDTNENSESFQKTNTHWKAHNGTLQDSLESLTAHINKGTIYLSLSIQDEIHRIFTKLSERVEAKKLLQKNHLYGIQTPNKYKIIELPPNYTMMKEDNEYPPSPVFFILSGKCQVWKDMKEFIPKKVQEILKEEKSWYIQNLGIMGQSFHFGLIPWLLKDDIQDASFSVVTVSKVKAIVLPVEMLKCALDSNSKVKQYLQELAQTQLNWIRHLMDLYKQKCEILKKEHEEMDIASHCSMDPFDKKLSRNPKLKKTLLLKELMHLLDVLENDDNDDDLTIESNDMSNLSMVDHEKDVANLDKLSSDPFGLNPFPSIICNRKAYGKTLPLVELSKGYENPFANRSFT